MEGISSFPLLDFFDVSNYRHPANRSVAFTHSEIGYFSIDERRYFFPDKSKLATLRLPANSDQLDIDLNVGFEQWQELPNVQQHLDSMLHWILQNKQRMTEKGTYQKTNESSLNADFVTSRGNLSRILNVLNGTDGKRWTMVATRYRGTIYLSHIEEEKSKTPSVYAQRILYWGKRFEVELIHDPTHPRESAAFPQEPIKAYPGFFSVLRLQMGNHVIALRAEVDARVPDIEGEAQEPPSNYVELKVVTESIAGAAWAFRTKKLIPWWCQSVIAGAPLVVYGIRDYDGHVKRVQQVRTDEIPDIVPKDQFDKERYFHFLNDVLSWMRNVVCEGDPSVPAVYMFNWDPSAREKRVKVQLLPRELENSFLRDWYVNEMDCFFSAKDRELEKERKRKAEETQRRDFFGGSRRNIPEGRYAEEGTTRAPRSPLPDLKSSPKHRLQDRRDFNEGKRSPTRRHVHEKSYSSRRIDERRRRSPQAASYLGSKRARLATPPYQDQVSLEQTRTQRRRNEEEHSEVWRSTRFRVRSGFSKFDERNATIPHPCHRSYRRSYQADPLGRRTRRGEEKDFRSRSYSNSPRYRRR